MRPCSPGSSLHVSVGIQVLMQTLCPKLVDRECGMLQVSYHIHDWYFLASSPTRQVTLLDRPVRQAALPFVQQRGNMQRKRFILCDSIVKDHKHIMHLDCNVPVFRQIERPVNC
jgi:hypothetical protein